jgi:glycosyltransferase involved in cell wall biosynthesis
VILFDLSRLLSRAKEGTPTGIDRVELAYAEHLIATAANLRFAAMTAWGGFGPVPRHLAEAFVAAIAVAWRGEAAASRPDREARSLARRLAWMPLRRGERALWAELRAASQRPAYLLVSHHHLERRQVIARLKRRGGACFVCLIHDLIPIEFPEYALPGQDERHRRRIETAAALADAVIVNSAVTRDAFLPYLERAGRAPPLLVVPFGVSLPAAAPDGTPPFSRPYFVCVSTIEARKNHLLLLNLWRRLCTELGEEAPLLVLIGRRGWETESVVDMLERCPALRGRVVEHNSLADSAMARLIKGARALLLPSFAEGFGFPLVEALALGVPALCSDIGALRESGGEVPEYLDPLDGIGWRGAIVDYAQAHSPRREAQLERLRGWRPVTWREHFSAVDALIAAAAVRPPD